MSRALEPRGHRTFMGVITNCGTGGGKQAFKELTDLVYRMPPSLSEAS